MITKNENTWLLVWGLFQGLLLLALHNWVDSIKDIHAWLPLICALYVLALALPISMQMLSSYRQQYALWQCILSYVTVAAISAAYVGWACNSTGVAKQYFEDDLWLLGLISWACWFMLLPFAEHFLRHGTWCKDYPLLFSCAWRNVVKLMSATLFVGVFWALLGLWGGLFKVLGITFFADLFTHKTFIYPATALAVGLGLSLYSAKEDALVGIYRATLNLLGWLLPMVAAIMVLFLVILPFKGLSLLWDTGYASGLMLGLLGLMVFLLNAAWQDGAQSTGHQAKFGAWAHTLIHLGVVIMPIYACLCAYALNLRVQQYGWTNQRVWAAVLVVIAMIYSIGYASLAIKFFKQKAFINHTSSVWMQGMSQVNMVSALMVVGLLALTQTPVLSTLRISANSQMARLYSGALKVTNFDFNYMRFNTGKYGEHALQALAKENTLPNAKQIQQEATAMLAQAYQNYSNEFVHTPALNEALIATRIRLYPEHATLEASLVNHITALVQDNKIYSGCLSEKLGCPALSIDLNVDGQNEVILFAETRPVVFAHKGETWQLVTHMDGAYLSNEEVENALKKGQFSTNARHWQALKMGEQTYTSAD